MALFRYLMEKILTDRMASTKCMLAVELKDIEKENFSRSLAKGQIR